MNKRKRKRNRNNELGLRTYLAIKTPTTMFFPTQTLNNVSATCASSRWEGTWTTRGSVAKAPEWCLLSSSSSLQDTILSKQLPSSIKLTYALTCVNSINCFVLCFVFSWSFFIFRHLACYASTDQFYFVSFVRWCAPVLRVCVRVLFELRVLYLTSSWFSRTVYVRT